MFDDVTSGDVGVWADVDLFEMAKQIEGERCRLDALQGSALAELEARGATDRAHGLRTWSWLAREAGLAVGTAKARVRVGEMLSTWLPQTRRALEAGAISFDHARVLTDANNPRIRAEFALLEGELIALADGMGFGRWRDHVLAAARLLDQDGAFDPNVDLAANKLSLRPGLDGDVSLDVDGHFTGELAVVAEHTLGAVTDELYRRWVADAKVDPTIQVPPRTTLQALAFVEICRRAQTIDTIKPGVAPKTDATLVVQAHDLSDVRTERGIKLQHGQYACLMCDLRLHPVVVDSLGVPLDMGRAVRWATPPQRRALKLRDGGCVFPGCGCDVGHTDAHHVDEWDADHGETDVKRMVLLCRHHHGVVHRRGWKIEIDDDGWATFTTPDGRTIDGQRHQQERAGPLVAV